jgi:hypothetical protein
MAQKSKVRYRIMECKKHFKLTGKDLLALCEQYLADGLYIHHYFWLYQFNLPLYIQDELRSAAEFVGTKYVRINATTLHAFLLYIDHRKVNIQKEAEYYQKSTSMAELQQAIIKITQD